MKFGKPSYYLLLCLLILFFSCTNTSQETNGSNPGKTQVKSGEVKISVKVPATLELHKSNTLFFEVAGTVDFVADPGTICKKGQVIAKLNTRDLKKTADEAKITYDKAVLTLQKAKEILRQAVDDWNRYKALRDKNAATEYEVQTQYNTMVADQLEVKIDEAASISSKLDWNSSLDDLESANLKAPYNGVVLNTDDIKVGTYASAHTGLLSYGDLGDMEASAQVDEFDIGKVKVGQKAIVTVDSISGKQFSAVIRSATPVATVSNNVPIFTVIAKITTDINELRSGLNANLEILSAQEKGLYIPSTCIKKIKSRTYVEVPSTDDPKQTEFRSVKVGTDNGTNIIIRDGLNEGETVLTQVKASVKKSTTQKTQDNFGGPPPMMMGGGGPGPR